MAGIDKHSVYYRLPERFCETRGGASGADLDKMYESSRFKYISEKIKYCEASLLDIGCNTGYFLFSALDAGAKEADCYEGSSESCTILREFAGRSPEAIKIHNKYFDFDFDLAGKEYGITHLLNVVHHLGDDYGFDMNIVSAKKKMLDNINSLAACSEYMIFQMGFNWQGDIQKPLFSDGTKKEMICFVEDGTAGFWEILNIGVAVGDRFSPLYVDLDEKNIIRDDLLGEFLNRPLFLMRSIK